MVLRMRETGAFSETLQCVREQKKVTLKIREQDGNEIKVSGPVKPGKRKEWKRGREKQRVDPSDRGENDWKKG